VLERPEDFAIAAEVPLELEMERRLTLAKRFSPSREAEALGPPRETQTQKSFPTTAICYFFYS
jgi:hypothetical protein